MTSTLRSPSVSKVLQRLLSAEEQQDPQEYAAAGVASTTEYPVHLDAAQRAEVFGRVYMSVSSTGGELLYLFARAVGAPRWSSTERRSGCRRSIWPARSATTAAAS
jgi:hypothetical protein